MPSALIAAIGFVVGLLSGLLVYLLRRGVPRPHFDQVQQELNGATQKLVLLEAERTGLQARQGELDADLVRTREELTTLRDERSRLREEVSQLAQRQDETREAQKNRDEEIRQLRRQHGELSEERSRLEEKNQHLQQRLEEERRALEKRIEEQRAELDRMQKSLREQFENLANRIFDEKSERFSKLNEERLKPLLDPLRQNIEGFRQKVESVHLESSKQNAGLIEQIKQLQQLNQQISTDATNLTRALKGDVKVMGNWGELILERILESSGLREGIEFHHQAEGLDLEAEPGKGKPRPDVVVHLPEDRHIVIDSKVSLVAYERLANAATKEERKTAHGELTASIRAHIDGLHSKHYTNVSGMNAPDFVFLFMPIEASFTLAVHPGSELYQHGIEKNVLVVGPSALLATLRTIAHIWRQENQARNVLEIARQGAALYDKFVGFSDDLLEIRKHLKRTDESFESALNKLHTGRGNLVGQVERLKKLGVKTRKQIAADLKPQSDDEDDDNQSAQLTFEDIDED